MGVVFYDRCSVQGLYSGMIAKFSVVSLVTDLKELFLVHRRSN